MTALFRPGEAVASRRVVLSALDQAALQTMQGWLVAALEPDWLLFDLERAIEGGRGVLIRDWQQETIGLAVVQPETPLPGAAAVSFLAVDPARRFRGLGGEAGLALEKHLRAALKVDKVFAPVPDGRGLAVYFWLRLGYRPLLHSQAPWPLAGLSAEPRPGIWLVREAP